jgi:uncharacterized membrane protein YoaK (UPF0700 family)
MIRHARRRRLHAVFAWPLLVESALVFVAGVVGAPGTGLASVQALATVCALTFAMGLQNALITKISRGEIRTTHVTGIVTDLGIEFGRGLERRLGHHVGRATPGRARLLASLLAAFAAGCIGGTFAAQHVGRLALLPVALAIGVAALVPAFDDLSRRPGRNADASNDPAAG